jgi:hypothetical protein
MSATDQTNTPQSTEQSLPPAISIDQWAGTQPLSLPQDPFIDRRGRSDGSSIERRQFKNSHDGLSPDAQEFALAVDHYKIANRRRFISYDEILSVLKSLGYHKD